MENYLEMQQQQQQHQRNSLFIHSLFQYDDMLFFFSCFFLVFVASGVAGGDPDHHPASASVSAPPLGLPLLPPAVLQAAEFEPPVPEVERAATTVTDPQPGATPAVIQINGQERPQVMDGDGPEKPPNSPRPTEEEDPKKTKTKTKKPKKPKKYEHRVSYFTLLRFTTWKEKIMWVLGVIGGLGHGCIQPLFIRTFGGLLNSLGTAFSSTNADPGAVFSQFNDLILILVYLAAAALVGAYLRSAMFIYIGHSQANSIRREYFKAILRQEVGWFDSKRSGELTTRLTNDVPLIRDALSEKVGVLFFSLGLVIAGFAISFDASWQEALVVLAGTPALIVTVAFVSSVLFMYSNKAQQVYASAGTIAQEAFGAVKTVMVFGGQTTEENLYDQALDVVEKTGLRKSVFESFGTSLPFFVGFGLYALAIWYGSTLVNAGQISAGDVFVSFLSVIIACSGLGFLSPSVATMSIGCGAAYEIFQVIDRQSRIDTLSQAGLKPDTFRGDISFRDVEFTYPTRPDSKILRGISLDIPSGKTVALVGKSGSGKSTIVALLERFYNTGAGSVTIDNVPIEDYNVKWLRTRIGIVSQEPTLFAGTVAENISISKRDATQEEIVAAAKEANAHDFITQLPEGYDTIVYQKGGNLSGGQKQRIAIARALIQKPQILLLDEATSALDTKSERLVQQALDRASLGRSTVVIAHRLSTIMNANEIYVFDQGRIIERGNHDELMTLAGVYANMVHLQSVAANREAAAAAASAAAHETHADDHEDKPETEEIVKPLRKSLVAEKLAAAAAAEKELQERVTYGFTLNKIFRAHWRDNWPLNTVGICMGICQGAIFPIFGLIFAKAVLALLLETGAALRNDIGKWCIVLAGVGFGGCKTHLCSGGVYLLPSHLVFLSPRRSCGGVLPEPDFSGQRRAVHEEAPISALLKHHQTGRGLV